MGHLLFHLKIKLIDHFICDDILRKLKVQTLLTNRTKSTRSKENLSK